MTVAVGDVVCPAAIFPFDSAAGAQTTPAADALASGVVLTGPPRFGRVSDITADPEMRVDWNDSAFSVLGINSFTTTDVYATHNDSLRFVEVAAPNTVTQFMHQWVRLATPAANETQGLCVAVFGLEAGTTGKSGDGAVVTVEVVVFRTQSGQYLMALATEVEVVSGR